MTPEDPAPPTYVDDPETRRQLDQLEEIALWLDRRYLDPLINLLFPGGGNTLGSLIGLYGVFVAVRLGVHPIILARMLLNLGIDALLGSLPILGVVFDFFYRAHVKNLALLRERSVRKEPTTADWFIVLGAVLLLLLALSLPVILLALGVAWLLS